MLPTNRKIVVDWKLKQCLSVFFGMFLTLCCWVKWDQQITNSVNFLVLGATAKLISSLFELFFYLSPPFLRELGFQKRFDSLVVHGIMPDF